MSDYTELKRLAEKATPGPWWVDSHGMTMMSMPGLQVVFTHPSDGPAARNEETGNLSHWRNDWDASYIATANPETILALIAENERLTANVKLNLCDHPAIHQGDVDLLVAFVTGTSQIELAKVHHCTPPNISRKIRRVRDRLGWREGMSVLEIRARAEQLRALASQGAVVTADLMAERDQLKAEVAGLKTGYEAYERVNAELKAENERLNDEYDKAWRHDLNDKKNVQVLAAEVARLSAENEALRKDADRAAYWKQRAKSAEGHLFSGDFRAAAMELHKYSRFESTPWPELTGSQHALISSAAGAVIATVNRLRDARRPKNRDETDAIIWCACGDGYAANSYGAGFMDANGGVCANCDAAVGCGRSNSRGSEQGRIPTETPIPERSACRSENP